MSVPSPAPFALASLAALALLAVPAAAQTGPFKDGELLVKAPGQTSSIEIYRIDPVTGTGAPWVVDVYDGYNEAGWIVYDPYRGGVLAYTSHHDTGYFMPRLFLFQSDGSFLDLGHESEDLSDLAPVGDGRVYLRRAGELHLLDAANQLVPVLDAADQPITLAAEHLVYDPGTSSLIGAARFDATAPCSASWHVSIHKLPLDASGTKLSGPIACTSYFVNNSLYPIGIDSLPDGALLVTYSGSSANGTWLLLRVDPVTLAVSNWADPDQSDLNGGVWCPRLNAAVVLADFANELRVFTQGQSGEGQLLVVDVPVGDQTTGFGTTNTLADIDLLGPGCGGLAYVFGQGLAGTGGIVPALGPSGCPAVGATLRLAVGNAIGGGVGVLAVGKQTAPYPLFGGTGYVLPPFTALLPFVLGGAAGAAGAGSGLVPVGTPTNPALIGVSFFFQAGVLDAAAPASVSMTAALEIRFG